MENWDDNDWEEYYKQTYPMEIETRVKIQKIIVLNLNDITNYSSNLGDLNKALAEEWKVIDKHHVVFKKTFDKGIMFFTLEKSVPKKQE